MIKLAIFFEDANNIINFNQRPFQCSRNFFITVCSDINFTSCLEIKDSNKQLHLVTDKMRRVVIYQGFGISKCFQDRIHLLDLISNVPWATDERSTADRVFSRILLRGNPSISRSNPFCLDNQYPKATSRLGYKMKFWMRTQKNRWITDCLNIQFPYEYMWRLFIWKASLLVGIGLTGKRKWIFF